jgi:mRNA interferase MazF
MPSQTGNSTIQQGDVYWYDFGPATGSGPADVHPCVVVQNDDFNHTAIRTTVICHITSNTRLARVPGNVLLALGAAGLTKESVVNVSQLFTVDKLHLEERIGRLSRSAVASIRAGIHLLVE